MSTHPGPTRSRPVGAGRSSCGTVPISCGDSSSWSHPEINDVGPEVWYVPAAHCRRRERSMQIFHSYGLFGALRYGHVIAAVMWMGLLWFFNFVQTPAYAELEPAARNQAFDKLTWRALWWFRFAAMFTVASGLLVLLIGGFSKTDPYSSYYWKSPPGAGLAAAILFAL